MKKLLLILMMLMLGIFLVGCSPFMMGSCVGIQKTDRGNDEATQQEDSSSNITGTYVCENTDNYSEGYYPYLELYSDGTFYFSVNLGEGMGSIEGTYTQSGDFIELYVNSRDFSGFLGDDYELITFFVIDEYTLELYSDDVGITYSGEFFTR